jgi:hypothetical protein
MPGIDPKHWGAAAWHILHRLSFKFDKLEEARLFFNAIQKMLPCDACRKNFQKHIEHLPFPTSKSQIPVWVYHMHQAVNRRLKKDIRQEPTFAEVREYSVSLGNSMAWQKENPFFVAVAENHPGYGKADEEYKNALLTVMTIYAKYTNKDSPKNVDQKKQIRDWIGQRTRAKLCLSAVCFM